MEKILVTTDFSANSKSGLRFAIQLASQGKYALTFFHSYHITKPASLSEPVFESFKRTEYAKLKTKLSHFVQGVYKNMSVSPVNVECVIKSSLLTDSNIINYANQNGFKFICIGRRGGGKSKKFFGSNTVTLIAKSDVPVIAVPDTYRKSKITNILYASDLSNLEREVEKVVDFAKPLHAEIELLHFNVPSEDANELNVIEKSIKKLSGYHVKLHVENLNFTETLISNLERAIRKSKPSMMIMFTQQNRSFFEKLFNSSLSARYSFQAKIPLLVFKKA